jgi:hypothetical protein
MYPTRQPNDKYQEEGENTPRRDPQDSCRKNMRDSRCDACAQNLVQHDSDNGPECLCIEVIRGLLFTFSRAVNKSEISAALPCLSVGSTH